MDLGAASAPEQRPGRFPYIVIVLLVAAVVVASVVVYSLPGFMTETRFRGFVRDENGAPIANATISAVESSTRSAADGSYSISIKYNGQFDIQAEAPSHWVQSIRINDLGLDYALNFTLLRDFQSTVVTGMAFVNLNGAAVERVTFGFDPRHDSAMQVTVDDYDPNASSMAFSFGSSAFSGLSNSSWETEFWVERLSVVNISGIYGSTPGQCTNCYVTGVQKGAQWAYAPEGANMSSATSTVTLSDGGRQSNSPSGDFGLPAADGVRVSAYILGAWFNTTLPVTWRSSGPCMHLDFQMEGGAQASFRLFVDHGWVINMWQV